MNHQLTITQALQCLRSSSELDRQEGMKAIFQAQHWAIADAPVDFLLQALDDPDELICDRVVTALGKKDYPEAVPFLIKLLPSRGDLVRRSVVLALERLGFPGSLNLVNSVHSENQGLRHASVIFLGRLRDRRGVPALVGVLNGDQSELLRCDAADALGNIGAVEAVDALRAALLNGKDALQYQAVLALKKLSGPARPVLVEALRHPSFRIRRAAAIAFAGKPQMEALPALSLNLQDPDKGVQESALHALSSWIPLAGKAPPQVKNALEASLYDEAGRLRANVLQVLVRAGDSSILPVLLSAWDDADVSLQDVAFQGLQTWATASDAPRFLRALHDSQPIRRARAATVLGKIGDHAVVPDLLLALEDENRSVQTAALQAISDLGEKSVGPRVVEIVGRLLEDANESFQLAALRALGKLAEPAATPLLVPMLQSANVEARLAAVAALGQIKTSAAIDALTIALSDADTEVRAKTVEALGRAGDPTSLLALSNLLSDNSPVIERNLLASPSRQIPLVSEAVRRAATDIWRSQALKTIQLSAHHPKEMVPEVWQVVHIYIFAAIAAGQVASDIRTELGRHVDEYRTQTATIQGSFDEGITVRVTPALHGFEFNPPFHLIQLYEPWHRLDFRVRASHESLGKSSNGIISVSIDGAAVASIPISIYVQATVSHANMIQQPVVPVGSIFCSYSHEDEAVVQKVERVCRALGIDYLRDRELLRSGQLWSDALLAAIEQADVFQLFWSDNAARSEYVEKEWRHAHFLAREAEQFIRPVFWEKPISPIPNELASLHFAYSPELAE